MRTSSKDGNGVPDDSSMPTPAELESLFDFVAFSKPSSRRRRAFISERSCSSMLFPTPFDVFP